MPNPRENTCRGFFCFFFFSYLPMCVHVFTHLVVCNSFYLSTVEQFLIFLEMVVLQVIILFLHSNGTDF